MAITINGTGSITGISTGGLPDGIVDTDMLATDAVSAAKLQSNAITAGDLPSGSILQVRSKTWTTKIRSTSTTYFDVESHTITPSNANNKILILISIAVGHPQSNSGLIQLLKDGSVFTGGVKNQSLQLDNVSTNVRNSQHNASNFSIVHLDTAGGTSEITYKIQAKTSGNEVSINRTCDDINHPYGSPSASSITLIEVAE